MNAISMKITYYDTEGHRYAHIDSSDIQLRIETENKVPKVYFFAQDYDGELIQAATYIAKFDFHFKVEEALVIEFNKGCGKHKFTWKGGTTKTSITLIDEDDRHHINAFDRYCHDNNLLYIGNFDTTIIHPYYCMLQNCLFRYKKMAAELIVAAPELCKFIDEFAMAIAEPKSLMKLNRWLGYIQGQLIARGATTVEEERNFTRPLFKFLDAHFEQNKNAKEYYSC